jgi:hypothetical protein
MPYRPQYFLTGKKDGNWRCINDVQPLNAVGIRDSGMPPAVNEFSEILSHLRLTIIPDIIRSHSIHLHAT